MKRLLYLGYYLRQLDRLKLRSFVNHASQSSGRSRSKLLTEAITSSLRYNISPLDYFYFRFFELSQRERAVWAGTGYMYEYQLRMNPRSARHILEDKIQFNQAYAPFVRRKVAALDELQRSPEKAAQFLRTDGGKLVLKAATGQVGAEVKIINSSQFSPEQLISFMEKNKLNLIEAYVVQHAAIRQLSNSGLNTVRIFSQLNAHGEVDWLGARLRITVDSPVDNMAAGNLAAPIEIESGVISGPAVYSDITKSPVTHHPITRHPITGFQLPYWKESLEMVREAALMHPQNRSIGWDVAITDQGPELIEGNHNWCKLLWQLPVQRGLKKMLQQY